MKRIQGIIKDNKAPSNKEMLWLKPNKEQRTATFYYYGVNGWTPIDANLEINGVVENNTADIEKLSILIAQNTQLIEGNTTNIEELFKKAVTSAKYNSEDTTIEFYNKSEELLCTVDVSDLLVNGLIEGASLKTEGDTTYLVITFKTTTGTSDVEVDITTLIDVYTAGDGIDVTGNKISVKIDPESDDYLSVGVAGLKLYGVKDAINSINSNIETINNTLATKNTVTFTQSQTEGNLLGTITIDGTAYNIYSPITDLSDYYTKSEITTIIADYYTKTQIDSLFESYYTKTEIDDIISNYYTSTQIDSMFTKYYTMLEIDAKVADIESAISEKSTVSYTASVTSGTVIGTLTIDGVSYSLYSPEIDLSGYATTTALNNAVQEMTDALSAAVKELNDSIDTKSTVAFSQTQTEGTEIGVITIDGTEQILYAPEVKVSADNDFGIQIGSVTIDGTAYTFMTPKVQYAPNITEGTLIGYIQYTYGNSHAPGNYAQAIYVPETDLSAYYTSEQVDELLNNLSLGDSVSYTASITSGTLIGTLTIEGTAYKLYAPTVDLSDYYSKTEIDNLLSTTSAVSYSPTLTSGVEIGVLTINGTEYTLYADVDSTTYLTKNEIEQKITTAVTQVTNDVTIDWIEID